MEEAGAKMILRLCVAEDPKREYLMEMMRWQGVVTLTPVSTSDHRSCYLALRPVQPEPARGRGADAGAWRRRFV